LQRLAQAGFDPRYGARPLQRAIEEILVAPLSRFLLEHPECKGKTIAADFTDEGVTFSRIN
jgi:ATP-dependent Clp protease ATP-binding subunit ClpC